MSMTNTDSNDTESSPAAAPAGRTQSERSAASSRAMLDAAVELMVQKGSRASMMEVGRASGFSHGLVLARFGSKTGLVEAVIRHVQLGFTALVDRAQGGTEASLDSLQSSTRFSIRRLDRQALNTVFTS